MPTKAQRALFSEQTYEMLNKGGKQRRVNAINENIKKTGYKVDKEHSNRDIITYVNDARNEVHISHRGTDITGKKTTRDLANDLSIALGKTRDDKNFKKRRKDTERALKAYPDHKASGSGHSMGGSSITSTMASNKYVRQRMTGGGVDTFNAGATIFGQRELQNLDKEGQKEMKKAMTHNRTQNDIVSASMGVNKPLGKVVVHKEKKKGDPLLKAGSTPTGLGSLLTGNASAVLSAHSLHHFYDKSKYHDN